MVKVYSHQITFEQYKTFVHMPKRDARTEMERIKPYFLRCFQIFSCVPYELDGKFYVDYVYWE